MKMRPQSTVFKKPKHLNAKKPRREHGGCQRIMEESGRVRQNARTFFRNVHDRGQESAQGPDPRKISNHFEGGKGRIRGKSPSTEVGMGSIYPHL